MLFSHPVQQLQVHDLVEKIMAGIEFIETESDLLETYGIWNERCSSKIFSFFIRLWSSALNMYISKKVHYIIEMKLHYDFIYTG